MYQRPPPGHPPRHRGGPPSRGGKVVFVCRHMCSGAAKGTFRGRCGVANGTLGSLNAAKVPFAARPLTRKCRSRHSSRADPLARPNDFADPLSLDPPDVLATCPYLEMDETWSSRLRGRRARSARRPRTQGAVMGTVVQVWWVGAYGAVGRVAWVG